MSRGKSAFRVGRVRAYRRGKVWYLCYHECGRRRRPRVGPERQVAHEMAAQVNAQLVVGAPAALSFEPVSIPELRHGRGSRVAMPRGRAGSARVRSCRRGR